jgi:hypothetical protein
VCKVDLIDGEVTYNRTIAASVLTSRERAEGTCLTCRAVPTGEITIALRDHTFRRPNSFLSAILRYGASPPAEPRGRKDQ